MSSKLAINKPNDQFEQEADRVANQVVGMTGSARRSPCACGGSCPKCQSAQTSPRHEHLRHKQVKKARTGQASAPPIVHEVLNRPGKPLHQSTRDFMESHLGHDFSHVRVHTDVKAAESVAAVNAQAYTVGQDIVFGTG